MIKKIICSGILLCLFIAIPLAVLGVKKVEAGTAFNAFLMNLNSHYLAWKIEIPKIPNIELLENAEWYTLVVNFLINTWNIVKDIFNIFITLINVIIAIIQFICTFLFEIGYMIGTLISTGNYEYEWAWSGYEPYVPVL